MNNDNNKSIMERLRGPLPEYYDTMYQDGYKPYEILQAGRDTALKEYQEKMESQKEEEPMNVKISMEVRKK